MQINKFDEENINLNLSHNISKDDSKFGLLNKFDSGSLFKKYSVNRKDNTKVAQEKVVSKDNFSQSFSKNYKEDENISAINHQISYDKNQSEDDFYNRKEKQEGNRRLMKKEKIVSF
jgi:hypothetical protein